MAAVPSGVVPNYIDPPDYRKQTVILHSVVLTLITGAVAMRIYTRLVILKSIGIDDCRELPPLHEKHHCTQADVLSDMTIFAWVRIFRCSPYKT